LASGRETLNRIGIQYTPVDSRILRGGTYAVYFELLELRGHDATASRPPL
jgi:hypothetical protein